MLDALAGDLAKLRDVASTLGDGLHELVELLEKQAAEMRGRP
jgi:hypothetical protein